MSDLLGSHVTRKEARSPPGLWGHPERPQSCPFHHPRAGNAPPGSRHSSRGGTGAETSSGGCEGMMEMVFSGKNPPQRLGCPRTLGMKKKISRVAAGHTPHHRCPCTQPWPGRAPAGPQPLPHPSLTFPFHSRVADPPSAPRGSPQQGLSSPGPCWQMLQHRGTLPCPDQGREEMRAGHGKAGSRDSRDITGSALPSVLPPRVFVSILSQPSL